MGPSLVPQNPCRGPRPFLGLFGQSRGVCRRSPAHLGRSRGVHGFPDPFLGLLGQSRWSAWVPGLFVNPWVGLQEVPGPFRGLSEGSEISTD